jgi:transcriptional regulator with XRE-family HTH domain
VIDFPTSEERRAEAQRLLEGLSGPWVAGRMTGEDYSVSKATIRLWRSGERIPDLEDLLRLPEATGRPLDEQLRARIFGDDAPPPVTAEKDDALGSG